MQSERVGSWHELQERLFADSWKPALRRFRSDFVFRGVADAGLDVGPSLAQLGQAAREVESHLLRNFRKYAPREAVPDDNVWSWLALAQHHGLPTRLLDWTYSPLVALHFATANLDCFGRDAVIWSVDLAQTNALLPPALRQRLEAEGSNAFTVEMLAGLADSLAAFDRLADRPFAAFFEPPSFDQRIVNQFALFSLMPGPTSSLRGWLGQHPGAARALVLPASLKWEVRDKLDQANVNERVLFPGLDGLSLYLRRYYSPRLD